ncbi:MAG: RNA polymerase sigma factor [Leptonema illini]|uniref:RNA polymerase, sigma-24 subunit, ECF subfamily n=2 Tax=Leptonema illini TaxID=183 RepID=H2CJQ4_9LEPT|nr:RNA polymerase sigma factor [Leptonema illini]EHQ08215.1 RNA polymerase, sigma-24 subunit, ECF subfamily [Leptonema illini DSM 21528]KAB2931581.1 MAG: RNA polymerase sigma factor [Leptonema illini]PKL34965.1 MAG: RNA polymerase sigma factor [Spirochaetae bacterium HGW-Spirochaetae-10]
MKQPGIDIAELFEQTRNMVFGLGMRLFRNPEEAADFSQDVYLRVMDKIDSFRGDSKPSTWVYSVAMHLGLNRLRRMKRIQFLPEDAEEPITEETPESLLTEALDRQETEERVQQELMNLPDSYRVPLLLLYYDRMSYREMSEKLGLPEGTLKSLVHRGKRILRDRLVKSTSPEG